jgi:excisionase family DNA binding protein
LLRPPAIGDGEGDRVRYNVVTMTPQRLFGIEEASERTGLPAWRIYSEIAATRLPCKRVGRRIYFSEADLLEYLQRIQQNGAT